MGGASQAMVDDPGWEVVRIENNPLLSGTPNTLMYDILEWRDWIDTLGDFDLVWASPPCTAFSRAYDAPMPKAKRAGEDYNPDLSLMQAVKEIIEWINPPWWVIENVGGATEWFNPEFGKPTQIVYAFYLWGVFPHLALPAGWTHSKFENDTWSSDPLRANKRGLVPLEISQALKTAVETQTTLEAWT
jgi:hypothetical protein